MAVVALLMAKFECSVNNAKIAIMKKTRLVAIKIQPRAAIRKQTLALFPENLEFSCSSE